MRINRDFLGFFGKLKKFPASPVAIVIHHTATSKPSRTRSALKKKGYSTHFEVSQDGEILQYAELDRQCSHCGSPNSHCIGIDVTHVTGAAFPDVQVQAVRRLVEWLCGELGIPQEVHETLSGIYPHSALGQTACPDGFPMRELGADAGSE